LSFSPFLIDSEFCSILLQGAMSEAIDELQNVFYSQIPLSKEIGLKVLEYKSNKLVMFAPLKPNVNHELTAFGGSLYCMAVLSGWGLLYLKMKETSIKGHILIQESHINYHYAVNDDIYATCELLHTTDFERFQKTFERRGIARIKLESKITLNNKIAVSFKGSYVVHK
jgi:thioesterase domain-containing protein